MSIVFNKAKFDGTLRLIAQLKKKPLAEVVNHALATAIIGAKGKKGIVQMAKRATPEKIKADLRRNDLNVKLTTAQLKREGYFNQKRSRWEIRTMISDICKAREKSRVRSRAYIVAGWIKSLEDLGMTGRASGGKRSTRFWEGGTAAQGYGKKATESKLTAASFSFSRGAALICEPHVAQAYENARQDAEDYYYIKMGQMLARMGLKK